MTVSCGMGSPARIPWIAFTAPDMQVSNGFYPVYLYYKDFNTLILAYGISETEEFSTSWPIDIMSSKQTIESFFRKKVPRYGDSRVFTAYSLKMQNDRILIISQEGNQVSENEIELDLLKLLDYYKKIVSLPLSQVSSELSQGLFYMEKELENFLINNWDKTELGKKYDLIIEDGELKSQQYRTDIGPIDILVRDKRNKNYVVIELKKNQTSDDTIGQIARYMGWVKEKLHDENVHGIIIAGAYDERLFYASKTVPNVELFIYKVDFKLGDFSPELKFDNS
jgi:predicted nuclease of restriction endonuclease-like (RecB) superfamily